MLELHFVQQNPAKAAPEMLNIIEKCFIRDFDNPSHDTQSIERNYKDCHIEMILNNNVSVGYLAFHPVSTTEIYLKSLAILPDFQSLGIGTHALQKLFELTPGKTVSLVVHPRNVGGIICYLKNGFSIDGWKENCFGDGEPRLQLHRES